MLSSADIALPARRQYRHVVPREPYGQARLFIQRMSADDTALGDALEGLTQPLAERFQRYPKIPSQSLLQRARDAWDCLPGPGRLADPLIRFERGRLQAAELRIAGAKFAFAGWAKAENGIAIISLSLICEPGRLVFRPRQLAWISHHCLGRYYERRIIGPKTDDQVLADIRPIALATGAHDDVVIQNGGTWHMDAVQAPSQPRLVRTFWQG